MKIITSKILHIYIRVCVLHLRVCAIECVFSFFFLRAIFFTFDLQYQQLYHDNRERHDDKNTLVKKKRGQTSIGFLKGLPEIPVLLVFHCCLERFIARHVDHAHVVTIMLPSHMRAYIRGFLRRVIAIRAAESR